MKSETVIEAVKELAARRGITVYLVGGYLRDRLLRRKSTDVDVVMETDALEYARELSRVFGYPCPIFYGRFGTAMIEVDEVKLELATCRTESYPADSRKPEVFKATIAQDLSRRDFTINAVAL
ncbi:MAG TPA: tRNA nucleotidyltransferase, partial [bacterium]|nr:tRNA nucleotidyltransferase [bacterium]